MLLKATTPLVLISAGMLAIFLDNFSKIGTKDENINAA